MDYRALDALDHVQHSQVQERHEKRRLQLRLAGEADRFQQFVPASRQIPLVVSGLCQEATPGEVGFAEDAYGN
jgi:hypothetical protein